MKLVCAAGVFLLTAAAALAATPRVSFSRTLPAPHDLGDAESVKIIFAIGDNEELRTFLEVFEEQLNDSSFLRAETVVRRGPMFIGETVDPATATRLRRDHPADAYAGVRSFTCRTTPREGEGSTHDADGRKVRRTMYWMEASCEARVELISGATFQRLFAFGAKGQGTSSRVVELAGEEEQLAMAQAARYAAIAAAEQILPRRVRDSVALDETAPRFEDGWSLIAADRLGDARTLWESALKTHRASAPLHFNLAAVCEALGDVDAATKYYVEARRISPAEPRYRHGLQLFMKRYGARQP